MAMIMQARSGSCSIKPTDTDMVLADHLEDRGWGYLAGLLRGNPAPDWMFDVFRNGPQSRSLTLGQEYDFVGDGYSLNSLHLVSMSYNYPEYGTTDSFLRADTVEVEVKFVGNRS